MPHHGARSRALTREELLDVCRCGHLRVDHLHSRDRRHAGDCVRCSVCTVFVTAARVPA